MAGLLALVWLAAGLCGHLRIGQCALTTERSVMDEEVRAVANRPEHSVVDEVKEPEANPCVGEQVLDKVKALEHKLTTLQQKLQAPSPYSVFGLALIQDLLEMKNKLVVVETKLEVSECKMEAAETKLETAETTLEALESRQARLESAEAKLKAMESMEGRLEAAKANGTGASTFVRWGRKTCSNISQLLYSGVVGGSHYSHTGAAANALCLTTDPEFDSTPLPSVHTYIYGAEYEHFPGHHDLDVPCSVCRTPHPTTLMIPSTHSCPPGWTIQYTGHLAAGHYTHPGATEFVCLDGQLEHVSGGQENGDGHLFYNVAYACGSLPCPPYVDKKVALCVVCSK